MIIWNRVTWYSKYLALIFFTIVFPIWTFYLGTQYEKTISELAYYSAPPSFLTTSTSSTFEITKSTTTLKQKINSGIKGVVSIGPICPVEQNSPDPNCADKPHNPLLIFTNTISKVTKSVQVSSDGTFAIDLLPGTYEVKDQSEAILPRIQELDPMTVAPNLYTDIKIQFDSGIR